MSRLADGIGIRRRRSDVGPIGGGMPPAVIRRGPRGEPAGELAQTGSWPAAVGLLRDRRGLRWGCLGLNVPFESDSQASFQQEDGP